MRILFIFAILVCIRGGAFVAFSAPSAEPRAALTSLGKMAHEMAGTWEDLHRRDFSNWIVASYDSGGLADGGSLLLSFTTTNGVEFGLLVANPHYWMTDVNNDKLAKEKQVFYIVEGKEEEKFFKILEGSKEEIMVMELLKKALEGNAKSLRIEDKVNLKLAIAHLKSRKVFPTFFDHGTD